MGIRVEIGVIWPLPPFIYLFTWLSLAAMPLLFLIMVILTYG